MYEQQLLGTQTGTAEVSGVCKMTCILVINAGWTTKHMHTTLLCTEEVSNADLLCTEEVSNADHVC